MPIGSTQATGEGSQAGPQLNSSNDQATFNYGAFNDKTLQDHSMIEVKDIGSPEMARN